MNYQKIYNDLVSRSIFECRKKLHRDDPYYVYYERHHIIPVCVGGTNDETNLTLLTANEHFVAHQLLVKIHPTNNSLKYALYCMFAKNNRHIRNNKEYGWIRKSRKNIKLTDDQKLHLSKINLGKRLSEEHRLNISKGLLGRVISDDTKKKIGAANSKIMTEKVNKGDYVAWNTGVEMTVDTKHKLSESLKETYKNGRLLSATCFKKGGIPHNVMGKVYYFQSPNSLIYKTDNITRFCNIMGISSQAMTCLNKGTYCSAKYKGWQIPVNTDNFINYMFHE